MSKKFTKTEKRVETFLFNYTNTQLNEGLINFGIDTSEISNILELDRANTSRVLNHLTSQGHLGKILTHPINFYSKRALFQKYGETFIPESISNYETFYKILKDNNKSNNITKNKMVIGINKNESLNVPLEISLAAITYPPHGLNLIIHGEKGTGISTFINHLFNLCLLKNIFSSIDNLITIDALTLGNKNLNDAIQTRLRQDRSIIVVKNFTLLSNDNRNILDYLISKNSFLYNKKEFSKVSFILTTNIDLKLLKDDPINNSITNLIEIPNFSTRTVKEKILMVLFIFYSECISLNKPIKLSKNIINCFSMSRYENNVHQLKQEIKSSILSSKISSPLQNTIEITFNHLSDKLLENIVDVNNQIIQLNQFYDKFRISDIFITPENVPELLNNINNYEFEPLPINDNYFDIESYVHQNIIKFSAQSVSQLNYIEISEVYDDFIECFNSFMISQHDNVLYGLLYYIKYQLIQSHNLFVETTNFESTYFREEIDSTVTHINSILEKEYGYELTNFQRQFISHYLNITEIILQGVKVEIIIASSNDHISNTYSNFANSLQYNHKVHEIVLDFISTEFETEVLHDKLINFCKEIDSGKGVIVLLCDNLSDQFIERLNRAKEGQYYFLNMVNIIALDKIMKSSSNQNIFIKNIISELSIENNMNSGLIFHSNLDDTLEVIQKILNESLTFLNPDKITSFAFSVLENIVLDLDVELTESLALQFITSCSYLIERTIMGSPLTYPDIKSYLTENSEILYILENRIRRIEESFGIKITQSEIIYLCEIIKEFI